MKKRLIKALKLTFENAVELYEDAQLLEKNNKLQRAFTLYHFSFEEAGRFSLILKTLFKYFKGEIKAKELDYGYLKKQGYENHIPKLKEAILFMYKLPIFNSIKDNKSDYLLLKNQYEKLSKEIDQLNKLKNDSLYITFEGSDFKTPIDSINEEHIYKAKTIAEIQIDTMNKILLWSAVKGGFEEIEKEIKAYNKRSADSNLKIGFR